MEEVEYTGPQMKTEVPGPISKVRVSVLTTLTTSHCMQMDILCILVKFKVRSESNLCRYTVLDQ